MKKATNLILAVLAASLVLAGCYDGGNPQDPIKGYDGFINEGWTCFEAGDYEAAREAFMCAIDMDVSRPEGYLGAGWCALMLPDYWGYGLDYDYMAVQMDGGSWPVEYTSTSATQNIDWTVFECVEPQLTATDMLVIESFGTTDTLIIIEGTDTITVFEPDEEKPAMDNQEIGYYLRDHGGTDSLGYGTMDFHYTFEIDDPNVVTLFYFDNGFSLKKCPVDSIINHASSSTVYLSAPYKLVDAEGNYPTWIMNGNKLTFAYASYEPAGGTSSIANDGVAAYGLLQHARNVNGNAVEGVAALMGLADESEYSFASRDNITLLSGITSLKMKGMAAAIAFANADFNFALYICRGEGYGMNISTDDPNFVIELMQVIETMLN